LQGQSGHPAESREVTQVARIYLVRHGEASAHWTHATDPGLSALGNEQARKVATRLAPLGPLTIASSPLKRARETAAPLEAAWQTSAHIVDAVAELPSPPDIPLGERSAWLARLMEGGWRSADPGLRNWRSTLLDFLVGCETNVVVFSHYVAINAAVGAALGHDEFEPFQPANASVTVIDNQRRRLHLIEQGVSGHHRPPVEPA
jgi:broad specificity phosphatase PhoE